MPWGSFSSLFEGLGRVRELNGKRTPWGGRCTGRNARQFLNWTFSIESGIHAPVLFGSLFASFLAHFGCLWALFSKLWRVWAEFGNRAEKKRPKGGDHWKIGYLFGINFGHLFGSFFFRGPPGHKKGGSGRAFETRPFFWSHLEPAWREIGRAHV